MAYCLKAHTHTWSWKLWVLTCPAVLRALKADVKITILIIVVFLVYQLAHKKGTGVRSGG